MNTLEFSNRYKNDFSSLVESIEVTKEDGNVLKYSDALSRAMSDLQELQKQDRKVIIVGNGGSAGIASHQAVDYWKNGGIKAITFNDSSLLTCISNDYSYEEVFSKPIEMFGDEGDLVFCISSSGQSKNILNAATAARKKGCSIYSYSGFAADNPLRKMGKLNFFVPSLSYGFVEILHLYIIHSLLDAKLYCGDNVDIFNRNIPINDKR